ncbi:MAG: crotonase/enoyl-CoA hydratase family protein [Caulobacterales bacterium]|nr:crotonase/enoyl-CoA hydratase family protein [Caulobacterales bacterium]
MSQPITRSFQDRVTCQIESHIAHVLLDRPDSLNALDDAMFDGIVEAGAWLHDHDDVRCVVLSGAGRAFCAGLDMAAMQALGSGAPPADDAGGMSRVTDLRTRTHGDSNLPQHVAMLWRRLPAPVIAAIHGPAFGGGLQIASGADIRIIAPEAEMSVREIRWGLVPDMGGAQLLKGVVRDDHIRDLFYTGRRVKGAEAVALGLATALADDPLAAAMERARLIASHSPAAIRADKRLLNDARDATVSDGLLLESEAQVALIGGPDQVEIVTAFIEKREPKF